MSVPFHTAAARLLLALSLGTGLLGGGVARADEVTVFAAASLKTALDEVAAGWQADSGDTVTISYGGSSALAKQIQEGAPADVFVSAAVNWMDTLEKDGLIQTDTRVDLLGNTLVLVAFGRDVPPVEIGPGFDLAGLLGDGKLSMALVDSVPAGQYGKEALTTLGVWPAVEAKVAQSENVRAALALVATGEAPYGIVYGSDAIADAATDGAVTVVGTFPADSHKPIVYPAAVTATAKTPAAKAFLDHLASPEAGKVFEANGFTVLD